MTTTPRPWPRPPQGAPAASRQLRPWPNLPSETQTQMAQLLGELLRRMELKESPVRETFGAEHRDRR